MEFYCWFIKLFVVLLMLSKVPTIDTRPVRGGSQRSDLIAGNEFLKLFLEHDNLHSGEYQGFGGGGDVSDRHNEDNSAADIETTSKTSSRGTSARSLDYQSRNANAHANEDASKQVVKLVTSGSKIVFLEEYDDDDAVVDAVARDIDLKREKFKGEQHVDQLEKNHQKQLYQNNRQQYHQQQQQQQHRKSNPSDEVKVVAVSVSSSSKRGVHSRQHTSAETRSSHVNSFADAPFSKRSSSINHERRQVAPQHHYTSHKSQQQESPTSTTSKPLTAKTTTTTTGQLSRAEKATTATAPADFINRSHKSEFSIEEVKPLTMSRRRNSASTSSSSYADVGTFYDTDSENSASTNIQNVLAAPLVRAPPVTKPVSDADDATNSEAAYHSSTWNATRINQPPSTSSNSHVTHAANQMSDMLSATVADDKLLPFQTVIYHDTKEGHGPQSRSISYSSISQNVEDLQKWQQSGILAEAQRNVSESLKSASHTSEQNDSEPAKFYSTPSKMYSVPAKFYSEPAKVYSEPAKVYGEPEKFYSEPAKVYSQPSKFYSEPAKVYSQPAKVYGEPAKTYWPAAAGVISTTTTTTPAPSSQTSTAKPSYSATSSSRRPAIVSRIAFGEAQGSSSSTTTQFPTHSGYRRPPHSAYHHNHHHHHHHQPHNSAGDSQPRRIVFNLDKLPYDLLNAPQQSESDLSQHSQAAAATTSGGQSFGRQRPCLESTSQLSSSSTTSSTSQQQHSSLLDQHSNQNAKGLPNRDLVKCVSKYSHSAASSSAAARHRHPSFTTERSHIEDLYTPTPEQNYEIEESVSVMTNGRAHGVQAIGPTTATITTTSRNRLLGKGTSGVEHNGGGGAHKHQTGNTGSIQYNTNANANGDYDGGEEAAAEDNYNDSDNDNDNDNNGDGGNNEGDAGDDDADSSGGNKGNTKAADDDDDSKVAYVVEGRNYRKYRVEEKTDDGFIVGEYGVVDHNDGNLRGVRYTADSTINRSLIQKALLTFLKLK